MFPPRTEELNIAKGIAVQDIRGLQMFLLDRTYCLSALCKNNVIFHKELLTKISEGRNV